MSRPTDEQSLAAQTQAQQLFKDLSDASLRDLAGDKVFARGQTYAASGAVQELEDLPPASGRLMGAQATVHGTELYSSKIEWLPAEGFEGDCDCPHGQDGFFCKHQVALAMVWRAQLGGGAVAADPAAAKKAQDVQARVLLLRLFETTMSRASTPYTEVLNLVRLALDRMNAADRALWLTSLRSQYKAKRNFIKELPIS